MSQLKTPTPDDMTQLLDTLGHQSRDAVDVLWPVVYDELRGLAASFLQAERRDHTLDATSLVHEAYVKLANQRTAGWADRTEFLAVASKVMRRILVDHARSHRAAKRGGGVAKTPLDEAVDGFEERAGDLIALDDALQNLAKVDARKARVVELRFFGGLSLEEVTRVLGVSLRTVERDWTMAKAWLRCEVDSR